MPQIDIGTELPIIPEQALWAIFGVVVIFTIVISIVLVYHWASYGYKPMKTGAAGALYITGALVLIGVIFFAIVSYLGSV